MKWGMFFVIPWVGGYAFIIVFNQWGFPHPLGAILAVENIAASAIIISILREKKKGDGGK